MFIHIKLNKNNTLHSDNSFDMAYFTFSLFPKIPILAMMMSILTGKAEFTTSWLENSELSYRFIFGDLKVFVTYNRLSSPKEHFKIMYKNIGHWMPLSPPCPFRFLPGPFCDLFIPYDAYLPPTPQPF